MLTLNHSLLFKPEELAYKLVSNDNEKDLIILVKKLDEYLSSTNFMIELRDYFNHEYNKEMLE